MSQRIPRTIGGVLRVGLGPTFSKFFRQALGLTNFTSENIKKMKMLFLPSILADLMVHRIGINYVRLSSRF